MDGRGGKWLAGVACPSRATQSPRRGAPCRRRRVGHGPMRGPRFRGDGQSDIHRRTGRDDDAGIGLWFRIATPHGVPSARNELRMAIWSTGEIFTRGQTPPGPPQVARIQRPKTQSIVLATRKPTKVEAVPGGAPLVFLEAISRNARKCLGVSHHEPPRNTAGTAIPSSRPRTAVCRRSNIIAVPAVLYPLRVRSRAHRAIQTVRRK